MVVSRWRNEAEDVALRLAKVLIDTRAVRNANPLSIVLFHDDGSGWRVWQYGSGFDCANEGVPPSIAADLEC
jgi:hypothetical protein